MTNPTTPPSPPRGPQVFDVGEATIEATASSRADRRDRALPGHIRVRPTVEDVFVELISRQEESKPAREGGRDER